MTNLNEALKTVRHALETYPQPRMERSSRALAALSQIEARLGELEQENERLAGFEDAAQRWTVEYGDNLARLAQAEAALRRVEEVSDLAGVRVARNYFTEMEQEAKDAKSSG